MINTKKIIALGLIAATGASMIATTKASAAPATASGTTSISYVPGQSTGGDTDSGKVADWTVDFPTTLGVNESNTTAQTASVMTFKLLKTKSNGVADQDYDGASVVSVKLGALGDSLAANKKDIKLKLGQDLQDGVKIGLTTNKTSQLDLTNAASQATEVGSLQKKAQSGPSNTAQVGAFITDKSGAQKNSQYSTSLTWTFTANN